MYSRDKEVGSSVFRATHAPHIAVVCKMPTGSAEATEPCRPSRGYIPGCYFLYTTNSQYELDER